MRFSVQSRVLRLADSTHKGHHVTTAHAIHVRRSNRRSFGRVYIQTSFQRSGCCCKSKIVLSHQHVNNVISRGARQTSCTFNVAAVTLQCAHSMLKHSVPIYVYSRKRS